MGDTGESCHIVNSDKCLFDKVHISEGLNALNGSMKATMKGKMLVRFIQADGASLERVIENINVCLESKNQLISITQEISQRDQIFNHGTDIGLRYPDRKEFFLSKHQNN